MLGILTILETKMFQFHLLIISFIPHGQILENLSRFFFQNFSFPGYEPDHITGKVIQFFRNFYFGAMSWTVLLETQTTSG